MITTVVWAEIAASIYQSLSLPSNLIYVKEEDSNEVFKQIYAHTHTRSILSHPSQKSLEVSGINVFLYIYIYVLEYKKMQ